MRTFFPPFFSLNLFSKRGLRGLLDSQLPVVAVTVVVFAFFFLLEKISIQPPQQTNVR
jgi:hypothetical protein